MWRDLGCFVPIRLRRPTHTSAFGIGSW